MVKIYFLVALLFVAVAAVMAAPVESEIEPLEFERAHRLRRVTCDLLSFGGYVGDSACAAHCLFKGKAGGHCDEGVCVCRKSSIKHLW
ncbi:PREDICTED: defensin-1-like [Dufourea novaeangliae]|uniref:defensin-1-like n=1 Tax=Dufourea novaeangliae TaxID=178035 RepID=UPI0007677663|nr:PREDICTED: defensin-1-like [Dufourea novaeangliae]